jgi:hypothetical protein
MPRAFALALDREGSSIAARIAMIAITTSNSISVNPDFLNNLIRIQKRMAGAACRQPLRLNHLQYCVITV